MNKTYFKLTPWSFIVAIVLFYILSSFLAKNRVESFLSSEFDQTIFEEMDEPRTDREGITLLFFYRDNSEICDVMRSNIGKLSLKSDILKEVNLYAVNVEEHAEDFYKYGISGIPNLLILDRDIELKRVMGVVSTNYLEKILQKIISSYN